MLTLRFQRVGKKHDTTFRIVAVDSRFSSKSGKVKEVLGWWDPRKDKFELQTERINYWLKQGAQTSDSCYNLLVKAKIIEGKKRPVIIHQKKAKAGETSSSAKATEDKETKGPKEETLEPVPAEVPIEPAPTEPITEAPEVKEETKEESQEEPKPEEPPKLEEKSEIPAIKEDADSK